MGEVVVGKAAFFRAKEKSDVRRAKALFDKARGGLQAMNRMLRLAARGRGGADDERTIGNRFRNRREFAGAGEQIGSSNGGNGGAEGNFVGIYDAQVEAAKIAHGAGSRSDVQGIARGHQDDAKRTGFEPRWQESYSTGEHPNRDAGLSFGHSALQLCYSSRCTGVRMISFSILDLSPIAVGASAADALRNTLAFAQHAEQLAFRRFWLAEHHGMPGIASAATAVVIGHVAGGTKTIRVGSGGIMLPNHSPLVIAEQFGTLASLYPGRIDLGLGRAPGTDPLTARALRRDLAGNVDNFPNDVRELQAYFASDSDGIRRIHAVPGEGLEVPIWLLGSSLFSAQLAAEMGLPFAFASHFAPGFLLEALDIYRRYFKPSQQLHKPYAAAALNVVAADSEAEARRNFTSLQQAFTNLRRGRPGKVPPPIDDIDSFWTPEEKASASNVLMYSVVGAEDTVERGLRAFIKLTGADELIIAGNLGNHAARVDSLKIVARVREKIGAETAAPAED